MKLFSKLVLVVGVLSTVSGCVSPPEVKNDPNVPDRGQVNIHITPNQTEVGLLERYGFCGDLRYRYPECFDDFYR